MKKILLYSFLAYFSSLYWRLSGVVLFQSTGSDSFSGIAEQDATRQPWMLAFLILLGVATAGYFYLSSETPGEARSARAFSLVALFFLYQSFGLLLFQEKLLSTQMLLPYPAMILGFVGLSVFFAALFARGRFGPAWALALSGALAYGLVQSLSLAFPLGAQSDMLLLIQSAGHSFLHGQSPYGLQVFLKEALHTTYLPGMWLSYLPFTALGLDLRLGNLIFAALFSFFAYKALGKSPKAPGAALLALFLLNPWLGYRHELYLSAYLWVLACFAFALAVEKPRLACLAFGWSLAVYPFSWFLLPIWGAWEAKRAGWQTALQRTGTALGLAFLIFLPFVVCDSSGFFEGVFGHWVGSIETSHYNLITWIPAACLLPIQVLACLGGAAWAWRLAPSRAGFYKASAVALGIFLVANAHGSHYFFFVFAALLYFYGAALQMEMA